MKRFLTPLPFFAFLMLISASSCDKSIDIKTGYSPKPNSTSDLVGSWRLIEQLADPGNGSGTFQPVTSQKTIQIYADSTFIANGQMCTMSADTLGAETGIFLDSVTISLTMSPCWGVFPITYQHAGDTLIIVYPCIEACRQKYVKL